MSDIFIARQPIYDRKQQVFAYELLYRSADCAQAGIVDGDLATSTTLLNAFTEIGLDNLVGDKPAFINLTYGFLVGDFSLPLPNQQVVLEILEDVVIDERLIQSVRQLVAQGYIIALDDFVYHDAARPLLELAHIVKIDLLVLSKDELIRHVELLSKYDNLKLLAEKVETKDEYMMCLELGFDYFQGYFFSRPNVVQGRQIPSNHLSLVQMLTQLNDPNITTAELDVLISKDVGLSYKLLRYINSAFFGLSVPVDSIQRAVVFLGVDVIKRWATLLVIARVTNKPVELMVKGLVRAKMCELLAKEIKSPARDICFTIGLLSVVDALLDMCMDQVLTMLGMSNEVNAALLTYEGVAGGLLGLVLRYESGDWEELQYEGLSAETLQTSYVQAVSWATESCKVLLAS